MKINFKRIATVLLALAMIFSTVSASAEWFFAGYDTRDLNDIGKIYNEVINGEYTNKIKIDPIDYDYVEWRTEGYEYAYPHAGYDRLYIEGERQVITRYNNLFPQWETRLRDYMWEICGDHRIYQRQQTKILDTDWAWDFFPDDASVDATLMTMTTRYADTVDSFKTVGFADLDLNGRQLDEENIEDKKIIDMYKYFNVYVPLSEMLKAKVPAYIAATHPTIDVYDEELGIYVPTNTEEVDLFSPEALSELDDKGHYLLSDELIADYVASIQTKYVTGPNFTKDGVDGTITKDVAANFLAAEDRLAWHWDLDTVRFGGGKVTWTPLMNEMKDPYLYYQYMIINGVVCDGQGDKPLIYRYTQGLYTPNVEWKYMSWDECQEWGIVSPNGYLDIIEWKYIDGKPAFEDDEHTVPVVRIPTGEYAKAFAKVTDTDIEIWRSTGRGADEFLFAIDRAAHDPGDLVDAFVPGTLAYELSYFTPHLYDYSNTKGHCID